MTKTISIATLEKLLTAGGVHLMDVRESDEYMAGHVPGAVNLPLSELTSRYQELSPTSPYHIICQSGGRSAQACAFLESQGYDVTNIEGGTSAWTGQLEQ